MFSSDERCFIKLAADAVQIAALYPIRYVVFPLLRCLNDESLVVLFDGRRLRTAFHILPQSKLSRINNLNEDLGVILNSGTRRIRRSKCFFVVVVVCFLSHLVHPRRLEALTATVSVSLFFLQMQFISEP